MRIAVAVGGTYGYLWYRFDQINKVHIADEVSASSGQPCWAPYDPSLVSRGARSSACLAGR